MQIGHDAQGGQNNRPIRGRVEASGAIAIAVAQQEEPWRLDTIGGGEFPVQRLKFLQSLLHVAAPGSRPSELS